MHFTGTISWPLILLLMKHKNVELACIKYKLQATLNERDVVDWHGCNTSLNCVVIAT